MKLKFRGRCVACYVPESVTAARVPVTVVLSGSVWPDVISEYSPNVGIDPANVNELNGWRCTYWLPADDVEGTVLMLRNSISVFPTHVGVFLDVYSFHIYILRLPHTRGGVPPKHSAQSCVMSSSPHTWGCSYIELILCRDVYVFPTHVGVFLFSHPR